MKPENKIDLHLHTNLSDGYSSPINVVNEAISKNITHICITDHYSKSKPAFSALDELERYHNILEELKIKFSSKINVSIGIEVDLSSINTFEDLKGFSWDLVLFEYVFDTPYWEESFRDVIKFKHNYKSKCNIGIAHTRFRRITHSKFDQIINTIRENDIIIELNTRYKNYLDPWFNYLDDEYLYSIGSDAHSLDRVGDVDGALSFLSNRSIPTNRIIQL